MKEKVLILGGTGFLGFHIANKCLNHNLKVISVSLKKPKKKRFLKFVKYLQLDITKKKQFKILEKIEFDYVINAAGHVDHKNIKKTYNSHFVGLKNLIQFLKKKKIRSFVQLGSSAEYGKLKSPQFETDHCRPKMVYGKSKYLSSVFLLECYKKFNFPVVILRLYQVYGPNQDNNRIIPIVINKSLNNLKFPCSSGNQCRDFLYISDCVDVIYKSLKNIKARGEIFNIGTGKPLKIKKVINKINNFIGSGKPIFGKIPLRKDEGKIIYPNTHKAKSFLKWKPKVDFKTGIKRTILYYKNLKNKNL